MTDENIKLIIMNKGTGEGGANTNYYGKKFEYYKNSCIFIYFYLFNFISHSDIVLSINFISSDVRLKLL
jgi:hypothetical protein